MQGAIINGYQLKQLLGRGGMAEVWYAENEIGKPAAVKILNESLTNNPQIVERFHNEALVMVKLDHPNIRQVYSYGYLGNRHCIVMEYLEGNDLEALMQSGRQFTDDELRLWWNQIADTLNYTHSMGVVHRDIKPSNLFLDKRGNIKLLDFGIAKLKESMSMTRTGTMMGTLMYMSPEQVMDSKNIDYHTDIYSLAVTFVHLLSGKAPYDSDTSGDYMVRKGIVEQEFDLSGIPAQWRGFLRPYLAKDPSQRPPLRPFEMVRDTPSPRPIAAQPSPTVVAESNPTSNEASTEHKSKAGLWIGLGVGSAVLLLLLVLLLRPKSEPKYTPPVQKQTTQSTTTTTTSNVTVPNGAAKGVFSIGNSKKVYFAKGNLQYQASSNTWRFAENQWDIMGSSNANVSTTYSGWVDLFCWGTGNNPTNYSEDKSEYSSFYDWGAYGMGDGWRTPTTDEWNYLFLYRANAHDKCGGAVVAGVAGIVVLPDDWTLPSGLRFNKGLTYGSNNYDVASWRKMEEAGAVFLPTAGRRDGRELNKQGKDGDYWSATKHSNGRAYNLDFDNGSLTPQDHSPNTHAFAVRLIKDK